MSAESTLYALLTGGSPNAVAAIVSDRVYPTIVPPLKDVPAIAFQRVSTEFITTVHSFIPLGELVTFDIFCVAADYDVAESLADAVVALDSMTKINRSSTYDADSENFAAIVTVVIKPA